MTAQKGTSRRRSATDERTPTNIATRSWPRTKPVRVRPTWVATKCTSSRNRGGVSSSAIRPDTGQVDEAVEGDERGNEEHGDDLGRSAEDDPGSRADPAEHPLDGALVGGVLEPFLDRRRRPHRTEIDPDAVAHGNEPGHRLVVDAGKGGSELRSLDPHSRDDEEPDGDGDADEEHEADDRPDRAGNVVAARKPTIGLEEDDEAAAEARGEARRTRIWAAAHRTMATRMTTPMTDHTQEAARRTRSVGTATRRVYSAGLNAHRPPVGGDDPHGLGALRTGGRQRRRRPVRSRATPTRRLSPSNPSGT